MGLRADADMTSL